jgi:hypothetical protein
LFQASVEARLENGGNLEREAIFHPDRPKQTLKQVLACIRRSAALCRPRWRTRYIVWIVYGIDPDISRAWTIDQGRFTVPCAGKL